MLSGESYRAGVVRGCCLSWPCSQRSALVFAGTASARPKVKSKVHRGRSRR